MNFLRRLLDKLWNLVNSGPQFKKFRPLIEAADEFFFGTDKTTKVAPHILDHLDIKRYMSLVIVALIPAACAGIYFYGLRILAVIAVSYIFGGLTEVLFAIKRRKPIYEGFLVTGLIFPLILPPTIPLWMVAVGVTFGVFFGKEVFGGTGRNIFNPALVGRVFLSLAFPEYFATMWQKPLLGGLAGFARYNADAITSATPLINFKSVGVVADYSSLLFGATAGSIGETFRIGIILGGAFLILTKIADWRIPVSYILSAGVFAFLANLAFPDKFAPVVFQLLTGGLLFGAFFMATDPVTAPLTLEGKWVYGLCLGLLTILIRALSGFAEAVMFAILLMNALAPLIDNIVVNIKFKPTPRA
jgi:RnfABCDGE-type electron transport complex D subunit